MASTNLIENQTIRTKLSQALELIQGAAQELNTKGNVCEGCTRFNFHDWHQAQLHKVLIGMCAKLRNLLSYT